MRETDLVARFGGDEFAILQDQVDDASSAEELAKTVSAALAQPCAIDGNVLHTTVSIGIVLSTDLIHNPENMIQRADLALYRAKNEGRSQYRFHAAELDHQAQERMTIGEDLHRAIARGEFQLYYQRRSSSPRAGSSASKVCCAGPSPRAGCCCPGRSFRLPRRPVPSMRSANG